MPNRSTSRLANHSGAPGCDRHVHGFLRILLVLLLAAGAAGSAARAAEPCAPLAGQVVSVEGAVELSRVGSAGFAPAGLGDLLCVGDTLRTGPFSRAAVALENESVLRLDERTI
ncbi:MAG TPA: hypothetical protein VFZ01_04490, partial [Geminicoccaceae bacterium]